MTPEELLIDFKALNLKQHDEIVKEFNEEYQLTNTKPYCKMGSKLLKALQVKLNSDLQEDEDVEEKIADNAMPSVHLFDEKIPDESLARYANRYDGITFVLKILNQKLENYVSAIASKIDLPSDAVINFFNNHPIKFHEDVIEKINNDTILTVTGNFSSKYKYIQHIVFGLKEDNADGQKLYEELQHEMRQMM